MGWTTQQYKASRREHREVLNALMIFEQVTLDDLSRAMGEKPKMTARWLDELRQAGQVIRVQGSETSPPYYRLVGTQKGR
jgi:DNA-binding MarR family transcriptional regulator